MDGQRKARKRETADVQMEKGEKRTFEIINYMPRIILFHKNIKKSIIKTLLKKLN